MRVRGYKGMRVWDEGMRVRGCEVGNTLEKRVETQRDDRGQEGKRGAGVPDFRKGAEEAWNRRSEEPVSLRDRQCMELVEYARTIRYSSDGHYFLQLQHKAQEVIHAKKTLNDQIVPTAWEFLEGTLALFYVIEEGGRIRPKQGYGVDEVPHCKQMLKDMRDNRKHEMQEKLKRFASGGSQRPHSFVGGTDQENFKRFPPVDSPRHHTLVGGTNQGPESQ